MCGRLTKLVLLVAICCLAPTAAKAQGGPAYGPVAFQDPGAAVPGALPQPLVGMPGGPMPQGTVDGYDGYGAAEGWYDRPVEAVHKWNPLDKLWATDAALSRILTKAFSGTSMRVEYLLWEIEEPGDVTLGAASETVTDLRGPFSVFDQATPPNLLGRGRVADLDEFFFRDLDGIRAFWDIPFDNGTLQIGGFVLEQGSHEEVAIDLPSPPVAPDGQFVGNTVMLDGAISNKFQFYDRFFSARYTTDLWGVEAKWIADSPVPPGDGLRVMPMLGMRYISLQERLKQQGIYDAFGTQPDQIATLDANTNNHLITPELGLFGEWRWGRFALQADPRIGLGVNAYRSRVITDRYASNTDPLLNTYTDQTDFTAVIEAGVSLNFDVTQNLSVYVGYDVMWMSHVARAHEAIRYDVSSTGPTSRTVAVPSLTSLTVEGLMLGATYRFR